MANESPNPFSQPIEPSVSTGEQPLEDLGGEASGRPVELPYDDSWKINRALGCLVLTVISVPLILFLVVWSLLRYTFW